MCTIIVINRGEKEISTPEEFKDHFEFLPELYDTTGKLIMGDCLCQCDLDKSFGDKNIEYKFDGSDYYIGQLDKIILD